MADLKSAFSSKLKTTGRPKLKGRLFELTRSHEERESFQHGKKIIASLLHLYTMDQMDFYNRWIEYRGSYTDFIKTLKTGRLLRSVLQKGEIYEPFMNFAETLRPNILNVYFALSEKHSMPTHYIRMKKKNTLSGDFWIPVNNRIYEVAMEESTNGPIAKIPQSGILLQYLRGHTDILDIQDQPPLISILHGGSTTRTLIGQISNTSWEIARQLSHMALLSMYLNAMRKDQLILWHNPGRTVLGVHERQYHLNGKNYVSDGITIPFGFQYVKSRQNVTWGKERSKLNIHTWVYPKIFDTSYQGLYYVLPQLRSNPDMPPIEKFSVSETNKLPKDMLGTWNKHISMDMSLYSLFEDWFLMRPHPLLGVYDRQTKKVYVFTIVYREADVMYIDGNTDFVCIGIESPRKVSMPVVMRNEDDKWDGNTAYYEALKNMLLDPAPFYSQHEVKFNQHRWKLFSVYMKRRVKTSEVLPWLNYLQKGLTAVDGTGLTSEEVSDFKTRHQAYKI